MSTLWPYALAAVLIFALIVVILLVLLLRRSAKGSEWADAEEPQEEEAKTETPAVEERPASTIPAAFRRAAKYIDRAADGDRKDVPLFLLAGDAGSRDSDLLAGAGLDLTWGTPEEAETSLGEGRGFWVFDRGVVLDLAGEETGWETVVEQLRRLRPTRPVDGVIVTFSCAELLEAVSSEVKRSDLVARAAKTYRTLWDAQQAIGFRLPTYILVTGCERLTGFESLCKSLYEPSRRNIVGWSNPNGIDAIYRGTWIDTAFESMASRLADVSMEVLTEGTREGNQLVRLPAAMGSLATSLRPVLESLFKSSAYHGTLFFRGLYFCGRETSPLTEDEPPSERVAFLAELLERKIFPEHRLASPTTRTVMARNRTVSIVKSIAAAVFLASLLSLGWIAYSLSRQNAILEPLLDEAAEDMKTNAEGGSSPADLGANALELLNGMSTVDFNRYDSLLVPASWFNPFQKRLDVAYTDAFHSIILRALRENLKAKSGKLVPVPAAGTESAGGGEWQIVPVGQSSRMTAQGREDMSGAGLASDVSPPWVGEPVVPLAELPEFRALRQYAKDLHELDVKIAGFNELGETGDLRLLGKLVLFAFGRELPETFYKKGDAFRRALMRAEYKKLQPSPPFRDAAQRKLSRLADEFHDALFRRNPFTARLQLLSSTVRDVTWEPPADGDTTPLQVIAGQLKRIDDDLSGGDLQWAFNRQFDFGGEYDAMVADVAATSYFGPKVGAGVRERTEAWWTRFQRGLAAASTPLTKTILSVSDGRPEMQLSKESLLLRSALQTFLGQPFVSEGRQPLPEWRRLSDDERLSWNTAWLDRAIAAGQAYDRSTTTTLLLFPQDARDSIDQVARAHAAAGLVEAIAYARGAKRLERDLEEQIQIDVAELGAVTPRIEAVLEAASRLAPETAALVSGSMDAEAYRILASVDTLLARDHPYATTEDIGKWDGRTAPSPDSWGKSDDAEVAAWLEATRGRIADLAVNYARPAIAWLTRTRAASHPSMRELVDAWQAILADVADFKAKKPGNAIEVLEDYIAVRMAKVTARDCSAAALPGGVRVRGFFGRTALDLSRRVRQRCIALAGSDITTHYATLANHFNQRLAGRYPFSDALPKKGEAEANPVDIRAFFELYDRHKTALVAPASQGGLDASQEVQRTFIDDMAKVRVFFAPFLDAPKEAAPSVDLEATFRVLKAREIDGQQIIGWTVEVGDETITNRKTNKPLRWTAGQPLRVTLRWAADSPRVPVLDGQSRASLEGDRKVVWTYANRWALLTALADHPVGKDELPGYVDALPVTMSFDLATKPAGSDTTETTPVRVFMRLALLAPGTNQPVELPRFPDRAPRIEPTQEALR